MEEWSTPRSTAPAAAAPAGAADDEAERLVRDDDAEGGGVEVSQELRLSAMLRELRAAGLAAARAVQLAWRENPRAGATMLAGAFVLTVIATTSVVIGAVCRSQGVVFGIDCPGAHDSHTTTNWCSEVG